MPLEAGAHLTKTGSGPSTSKVDATRLVLSDGAYQAAAG